MLFLDVRRTYLCNEQNCGLIKKNLFFVSEMLIKMNPPATRFPSSGKSAVIIKFFRVTYINKFASALLDRNTENIISTNPLKIITYLQRPQRAAVTPQLL